MSDINMRNIIHRIVNDVRVEMSEEFDKNFERQGFFSEAWSRSSSPVKQGSILIQTGSLRRSIQSRIEGDSVVFFSNSPYAAIHNEGGEIRITDKMHRFFWAKYYEAQGGFGRKKNGELRKNKRNLHLSDVGDFWKWLALKKVGSSIRIPKRQFLGANKDVEQRVMEIVEKALNEAIQ